MIILYAILPARSMTPPALNSTGELHTNAAIRNANATTVGLQASTPPAWFTVWHARADQPSSTTWGNVMTRHRRTRLALAALVTVTGLGLSACTSDNRAAPASSTPAPPPAPSTTAASPADIAKQEATAAYLGMWSDMADAAMTSDWQSPKLAQNATAEALSKISRGLYADHYNGLVTKGKPENAPTVESVEPVGSPTTVNIVDCGDDSQWIKYRADDGQPANDGPGGRRHINAMAKKAVDGSWKVTDFAIQDVGTC